ncbi:Abi-domain-containing protein [Pholiota conissans]|uniref:intramembrane prenyl-peptidase Rce1 n=1 Tax=Pholiota conissans TaxID=109636 RepID=A0A9P5YWX7_9AGAR|nr:Abi-domain-containing protein [Pholiota conissans]
MTHSTYNLLFPEPLLSTSSAHIISLLLSTIYVGSIYFSQRARLSLGSWNTKKDDDEDDVGKAMKGTRDDPDIVRARLLAVSLATIACMTVVFGVLWSRLRWDVHNVDLAWDATILRLGLPLCFIPASFDLSFTSLLSILPSFKLILPHLVVPILFSGPLFACFLGGELPGQRHWRWNTTVVQRFFTIHGARNYFIAPMTEEVVFRGCVLAVWHMADAGTRKMVWLAPLTFGLAHVHHVYENFHRFGSDWNAAKRALFITLFQLGYTTVFGAMVSFIFLRTGSILPPITAHMFCNIMGFPDIGTELRRFPKWRRAIITAYVLGIAGFIYTLNRWTVVANNIYWPRKEDVFVIRRF